MASDARKIALELNIPTYESEENCPRGHGKIRYAKNNACVECAKLAVRRSRDPHRIKKYKKKPERHLKIVVPSAHASPVEEVVVALRALGLIVKEVKK